MSTTDSYSSLFSLTPGGVLTDAHYPLPRFGRKGVAINFTTNDDIRVRPAAPVSGLRLCSLLTSTPCARVSQLLRDIEQYYSTQIDESECRLLAAPAPCPV